MTDSAAPTVTVAQSAGQADPTAAGPIRFTVIFSKPVTGLTRPMWRWAARRVAR